MKNYLIIAVSLVSSLFAYSQEGIEIPLNYDTNMEVSSGTYIKDIENVLNPYIGTWEGTWEEKKFTLKIEKIIKKPHIYDSGYYYYRDELVGKYSIINLSDGSEIENNLDFQPENAIITSLGRPKDDKFSFFYSGSEPCGYNAHLILIGNPDSNQLLYKFLYNDINVGSNCVDINPDDIPINIPIIDVSLIKL